MAMLSDNTEPSRKARIIALSAVVLALAGGLWLFNKAGRDPAPSPPAAVTTSCSEFAAAAHRLFDKGDTATLRGTFAPGEQVHLAIDFKGVSYSWEATGVLAKAPQVFGSVRVKTVSKSTYTIPPLLLSIFKSVSTSHTSTTTVSRGTINGPVRLEVDVEIATAGDGAITISKPSDAPSFTVAGARCSASKKA